MTAEIPRKVGCSVALRIYNPTRWFVDEKHRAVLGSRGNPSWDVARA